LIVISIERSLAELISGLRPPVVLNLVESKHGPRLPSH
jgi:hypothetical protein